MSTKFKTRNFGSVVEMGVLADAHFAEPRLANIYDDIDPDRTDLDHYLAIIEGQHARSILDVGCGTGTLACRLAMSGLEVIAVDPALASLEVARRKPGSDRVSWVHGTTSDIPKLAVDMATMTGNVAQVFLTDHDWAATLTDIRSALRPSGYFIFETRDPKRRSWEEWTTDKTRSVVDIPQVGTVEYSVDLLDVSLPFVKFRSTYRFDRDGAVVRSDSTLRFRGEEEVRDSLAAANFLVREVRDAPDRPGREFVFIVSTK